MSFVRWAAGFVLAAFFMPIAAFGQGAVLQSGVVTPGHGVVWSKNGIIADSGLPANGSFCALAGCAFTGIVSFNGGFNGTQTFTTAPATGSAIGLLNGNYNYTSGTFTQFGAFQTIATVTGAPSSVGYMLDSTIFMRASHGSDFSDPGTSNWVSLVGSVQKDTPVGGFTSNGGQEVWSSYFPYINNTNLPSSIEGADTLNESDMWQNNLDTSGLRHGFGISFFTQIQNGYSAEVSSPFYVSCTIWCGRLAQLGGAYEITALDLRAAGTTEPKITSATPGSSVYSVTVDNVMPIASGGTAASAYIGSQSTAAITNIVATADASGTDLTISAVSGYAAGQSGSTDYVMDGMYLLDLTTPTAVPVNTTISAMGGTDLTTSASTTIGAGDDLIFSRGLRPVTINGDSYVVAGITLPTQNSTVGEVYFQSAVTVADATNGNFILPAAHTIWMWEGTSSGDPTPPDDIAFTRSGNVSLGCSSSSACIGLALHGAGLFIDSPNGNWSSSNFGKGLLVTTGGSVTNNPAIGFTDANGANLMAISNEMGTLNIAKMPAFTDSADAPVILFSVGADVVMGQLTALATAATTGFTHPFVTTTGTPTGSPITSTTPACVVNTGSATLNCYFGASWHHIAFSSGAG